MTASMSVAPIDANYDVMIARRNPAVGSERPASHMETPSKIIQGPLASGGRSMCTVEIEGVGLPFEINCDPAKTSLFALGVRKSGSTMLYSIVIRMARLNGYQPIDVPGALFRKALLQPDWQKSGLIKLVKPGNIYLGFRAMPEGVETLPAFRTALKIFMHRDPRDALVSQYFSDAFSHSLPDEDAANGEGRSSFVAKREEALRSDINEWVLDKAESMRNTMQRYEAVLSDPRCLVLRYEEYVFQKRRMIHKIQKHYGWVMHPNQVDHIIKAVDIRPEKEEPQQFVRKAVPGDHMTKLTRQTIDRLNARLKDVLRLYDYY